MKLNSNNLKIALQKSGRLSEKSVELLEAIGLEFEPSKDQLFASCRNFPLDILFLRDDDIPEYVQDGVCDLGIAGINVISEKKASVKIIEKLGFGNCRLAIAVPDSSTITSIKDLQGKRIATTYPNALKVFLDEKGITAEIIKISGSVEIAPSLDLSDAIADLVSSGNTLKRNGLKELEMILASQAVLIMSNNEVNPEKKALIDRLLLRIRATQQAKKSKYVLMNAPEASLENIKKIVPALSSPTIVPLATPGMIAIHTVIEEEVFWDVMEKLKAAGASGILVLPIEKMIL
jgi:ATP phosphoribosyltransferase